MIFLQVDHTQVLISTTILTGYGQLFSGMLKVAKVSNMEYLWNNGLDFYDLLHTDRPILRFNF